MNMKLGKITNPLADISEEIKATHTMGFDFIEIGIEGPEGKTEILSKKKAQITKLLKKYKIFAIGHTSWWFDLGSDYEPVRKAWIEEAKKAILLCSELGIKLVNFHAHSNGMYMKSEKGKKIILRNIITSLKEIVKFGHEYGVDVMLENMPDRGEIRDFEDFKYVIDRVPGLKVHLDIGHAFINGGMKSVENYIKTFRGKLYHIHIHDNHGEEDEHLPLGSASVDYKSIIAMLKKIRYDKTMTFEIFTKDTDLLEMSMKKVRNLMD
jgi:sugar phosphate isomerase/epimerase